MKVKLAYKFFMAFSLTALMIVMLMIGIMQFFIHKNFSDYVNQTMLAKLDNLVSDLQEAYRKHNRWDPDMFEALLDQHLQELSDFRRHKPQPPPEDMEEMPDDPGDDFPNRPPPPDFQPPPHMEEGPNHNFLRRPPPHVRIDERLSLFDAEKQPVAGPAHSSEGHIFREIVVDGKIVGWLGIRTADEFPHPLGAAFLTRQTHAFYVIGVVILILAGIVSLILSKHLLAPIRQLAKGTKGLSSLKFDTKINVDSEDELGQLADDFNIMADTLQKYEQMRQQWITDISHELRTPLSVLRGEIEAMQDGIREMNMETLESLHSEILHISKLVNDLHLLSLADSQNLHFRKESVNLSHILTQTLDIFRIGFRHKQIDIIAELGDTDMILPGDADRLRQLFSNLLENTLRYADSPGTLTIRADHSPSELTIYFEDSGPGVPQESLDRLFERLYRVEKSRSRVLGGSGLGLAICKEIVERHGGTIRAENAKSGGLRMIVVFRV